MEVTHLGICQPELNCRTSCWKKELKNLETNTMNVINLSSRLAYGRINLCFLIIIIIITLGNTGIYYYTGVIPIWDRTVLPATRHKWTHSASTTARQAGTRLIYSEGMEGWVDLGNLLHIEMPTRPQTVTHPSTNRAQCRLTTLIEGFEANLARTR